MSNKLNILVTGANGQLGMEFQELQTHFPLYHFLFTGKDELSITDINSVEKYFSTNNISYCINCAAYTSVDNAETESEAAFEINAVAVGDLARICKDHNTQFIHISTDYVFDGKANKPYREVDKTNSLGVYGASKLRGEISAIQNNERSMIIRTSWVYSRYGKNFLKTMIRLMKEKEKIGVVDDQFGSPTYAADLAEAILQIISKDKDLAGIYHYCNEGETNWYDFAVEIKRLIHASCQVNSISTAAYPTRAIRPQYSVLDTTKIKQSFELAIPAWRDSLKKCVTLIHNS